MVTRKQLRNRPLKQSPTNNTDIKLDPPLLMPQVYRNRLKKIYVHLKFAHLGWKNTSLRVRNQSKDQLNSMVQENMVYQIQFDD